MNPQNPLGGTRPKEDDVKWLAMMRLRVINEDFQMIKGLLRNLRLGSLKKKEFQKAVYGIRKREYNQRHYYRSIVTKYGPEMKKKMEAVKQRLIPADFYEWFELYTKQKKIENGSEYVKKKLRDLTNKNRSVRYREWRTKITSDPVINRIYARYTSIKTGVERNQFLNDPNNSIITPLVKEFNSINEQRKAEKKREHEQKMKMHIQQQQRRNLMIQQQQQQQNPQSHIIPPPQPFALNHRPSPQQPLSGGGLNQNHSGGGLNQAPLPVGLSQLPHVQFPSFPNRRDLAMGGGRITTNPLSELVTKHIEKHGGSIVPPPPPPSLPSQQQRMTIPQNVNRLDINLGPSSQKQNPPPPPPSHQQKTINFDSLVENQQFKPQTTTTNNNNNNNVTSKKRKERPRDDGEEEAVKEVVNVSSSSSASSTPTSAISLASTNSMTSSTSSLQPPRKKRKMSNFEVVNKEVYFNRVKGILRKHNMTIDDTKVLSLVNAQITRRMSNILQQLLRVGGYRSNSSNIQKRITERQTMSWRTVPVTGLFNERTWEDNNKGRAELRAEQRIDEKKRREARSQDKERMKEKEERMKNRMKNKVALGLLGKKSLLDFAKDGEGEDEEEMSRTEKKKKELMEKNFLEKDYGVCRGVTSFVMEKLDVKQNPNIHYRCLYFQSMKDDKDYSKRD